MFVQSNPSRKEATAKTRHAFAAKGEQRTSLGDGYGLFIHSGPHGLGRGFGLFKLPLDRLQPLECGLHLAEPRFQCLSLTLPVALLLLQFRLLFVQSTKRVT